MRATLSYPVERSRDEAAFAALWWFVKFVLLTFLESP
jgi:hypothetical protein